MIKEKYMVISYGDNDFWNCADEVMKNIRDFKNFKDYWDKEDLEAYCINAFDVYVKNQTLVNKILRRCSNKKLTGYEIKLIVKEKEYYKNVKIRFFNHRYEFPEHWDNCEHYYINLETGEFSSL